MDTSNKGESPSSSTEEATVTTNFQLAKMETLKSIGAGLNTWQLIWSGLPKKTDDLLPLYLNYSEVLGMIPKFYPLWAWLHYECSDILNEVDRIAVQLLEMQVQLIVINLKMFADKFRLKVKALQDSFPEMGSAVNLYQIILEEVKAAKNMEDLEKVQIPDLTGLQNATAVEALEEEWNGMELKPKFQRYIRELQEITTRFSSLEDVAEDSEFQSILQLFEANVDL